MPSIFSPDFLTNEQLANLKLYKYAAVDLSFTSRYLLVHYWNWAVGFFPMRMAPNLITLTGLMFMIINVAFAAGLSNEMENGPRWIYLSFAIGFWLYSTFDNVDGKQARRTGTSSPLGELFDHGCDALNCSFAVLLQTTGLGLGQTHYTVMLYGIAMLGFYLSTIEEYHTGILYLGYVNAPTEGVILTCLLFIFSFIYGPEIYKLPVSTLVKVEGLPTCVASLPINQAIVWSIGLTLVFMHIPSCMYAMYKACRQKNKPFVRTMLNDNLPIIIYSVSFYLWATSPYSIILSQHHFFLYSITTGIVFGRIASKVILAHLTKSIFPTFTVLLVPMIVGAILTNLPRVPGIPPILTPQSEHYFLWGFFGFALLAYLRWAVVVIKSFCSYLNINCLTIPKKYSEKSQ
ncbi:CDP-alcohol phosphatidyltransferase-domain-containing protein [Phycomyces nitens]|nr:CDP-alcohol phosphatidyltransferase-domain-containing protein [Phycomyces nitens]